MISQSHVYGKWAVAAILAVFAAGAAYSANAPQTQSASPLGNKDVAKSETALGSLVADATRKLLRTDLAFIAASELKPKEPPIPAGKIATADVQPLVSYPDDSLDVLQLTGKAIRQALEKSVSIYPQPNLGFLQVSGIQFTFDPKKPAGGRVTSIKIGNAALNDTLTYTVAVTHSIANGALGYWKVWEQDRIVSRRANASIVSAVDAYLKATQKIDYTTLDRISVTK